MNRKQSYNLFFEGGRLMSGLMKRGASAIESLEEKKVDLKNVYYRLKPNESVKVRILSVNDMVEYLAHSDYAHRIFTQPCSTPAGKPCPLCVAAKSGVEGYDALKPRKRYVFAFGDLMTGEIKILDVSKNQAIALLSSLREYEEELGEVAFTLKRTGEGTATSYVLNPILKMKNEEPAQFHAFDGMTVEDAFFNQVLNVRDEEFVVKTLAEAGFPVAQFFPHINLEEQPKADDLDVI